VCTHRLPCADRKQTQRDRIGDWRQSHKPIRFARTTVSTSAHRPQNGHFRSMIEQKPSIEGGVSHSSKPRLSFTYPCERAATISFAPSAEFSDAKVLNVLTRSSLAAHRLAEFSYTKVHNVVTRSSAPWQPHLVSSAFNSIFLRNENQLNSDDSSLDNLELVSSSPATSMGSKSHST
jgi:hypothetical protein